ncbi:MAG: hypothetical protein GY898_25740 [Proteobacteria bacterium]|nr:hypothetical protein [Pseudomonadota bacterium]
MTRRIGFSLGLLVTLWVVVITAEGAPIRAVGFLAAETLWTLGLAALEAPGLTAALLVAVGIAGGFLVRRMPSADAPLRSIAALPLLALTAFLLVEAIALAPLVLTILFGTAAAAMLTAEEAGKGADGEAEPPWPLLIGLALGGGLILAATHTFLDPVLELSAAGVGAASRAIGPVWKPLVGGAALVAAGGAGKLLGDAGFDWAPLALRPDRLLGSMLGWTAAAALTIAYTFGTGTWDCGAVDRDERVELLAPDRGGFTAVRVASDIVVSLRDASELLVINAAGVVRRGELRTWLPQRADADRLRPEVLLPVGGSRVLVLANDPAPGVAAAAVLIDLSTADTLAAVPTLECTEATDAVLDPDGVHLWVACPGYRSPGGDWVATLEKRRVSDLGLVSRTELPDTGIDRIVLGPDGALFAANPGLTAPARLALTDPPKVEVRGLVIPDIVLDLAAPGDGTVRVARYTSGEVLTLDAQSLRRRTATRIGWGTRALLCDGDGCAAASAITGLLTDVDSGETVRLGGHVRRLTRDVDGRFGLAASDCGVMRFERP